MFQSFSFRYATCSLAASLMPSRLPTLSHSAGSTPIRNATGANTQPKIVSSFRSFGHPFSRSSATPARISPGLTPPMMMSNSAMNAMNAISMAATFIASSRPSLTPAAAASMTLT